VIDSYVVNGKAWYGPADTPPTLLFDIADDESTPHDVLNEVTGDYYGNQFQGPFAWITAPAWRQYAVGWNSVRVALFCRGGTQVSYVVVNYDNTAPSASWSAPADNQWVHGTVALQAGGGDTFSGIDHFTFSPAPGTLTSSNGAVAFDTTRVADGSRTLTTTSVDRAGNQSSPQGRTFRVDNSAPSVSLDAPGAGTLVSSTLDLAASASDAGIGVDHVRFELRPAGGAWQALGSDSDAPFHIVSPAAVGDGAYDVRSIATDSLGNEAATPATAIVIDRTAPVSALDVVPASVSGTLALSATASDAGSGVGRVTFEFAVAGSSTWQSILAVDGAPFTARWATAQLNDGAYALRVVARDRAGNELASAARPITVKNDLPGVLGLPGAPGAPGATGTAASPAPGKVASTPAATRGRARAAVALRAAVLPRRVEAGHAVVVRGVAPGIAHGVVRLSLTSIRHPGLVQLVRTITQRNGSFTARLIPHFSGRMRLRFEGDDRHRPAQADAGIVRVHPRLVVTLTATHASDGSLTDPHVHGRLLPAGAPVRLAWQARPATGGTWLLFCRSSDQIVVGKNGVIDGTCHVRGLHADNRYRLVLVGGPDADYLSATSVALVARPTR
ncbi:MAG: Ig-like domain-containing protein, partial [Gaiellales bacterium]